MSNNYSFLIHKDSKSKYKGGFITKNGRKNNSKEYNHDYYMKNKEKWKGSEDELYHYGVPGMRWGFRKNPERALQKTIRQLEKYGQRAEKALNVLQIEIAINRLNFKEKLQSIN